MVLLFQSCATPCGWGNNPRVSIQDPAHIVLRAEHRPCKGLRIEAIALPELSANQMRVSGRVLGKSQVPLGGVNLVVVNLDSGSYGDDSYEEFAVYSAKDGGFAFDLKSGHDFEVYFFYPDYVPSGIRLRARSGYRLSLEMQLSPEKREEMEL